MDRTGTTSSGDNQMGEFFSSVPIFSRIIIVINVAVFIFQWVMSYSLNDFAISPHMVIDNQEYYRIISSAFTHNGIFHIGMNMMAMFQMGPAVENHFGSTMFLFITTWAIL